MAKKDKTDRKSFEDMRAEREAEVKASLEAASDRMADAQGEAMLANINRRTDEAKGERERVMKTAVNIGAPQASLGIGREDIQGNAGSTFKRGMNKSRFNVQKDLSEKADVARQEAVSDRMADAQGEAMLANISRRIDEVKGEEERKRNYHLLQASAIRENEKRRMEDTAVNIGEPPQSVERAYISGNAGRVFDQGIAKGKHVMRQDLQKMADEESVKAASDRMAEAQSDAMTENIKNIIAKRDRDAAEREEAEQRKAKYLSDQQAAIRANQKQTEKPAAPANNEPGNSAKTEVPWNTDERVEAGRAMRTGAQGNAEAQGKAEVSRDTEADIERVDAGRETRTEEQRGNSSNKAGKPAPLVVHNAEERFQKNLEDVQGKLKYEPILEIIRKYQEEQQRLADNRTPEQKKKAARREKMAKIFAALGDGVAAMSNLVLTSKGAIPYQSKSMISKAVGDRYDKFSKDLENRRARYLELSEKIAKLQQGVEDSKAEDERLKAAQELAKAELAYKQYKDTRDFNYNKGKDDRQFNYNKGKDDRQFNYNKEKDDRQFNYNKGKNAEELAIKRQQANAATTNARANASRAATFARNGGGGTRYEFDGKTYGNVHAYEAAIKQKAIQLGIPLKENYEATDALGNTRTLKRDKKTGQLLAEVNEKLAEQGGGRVNKGGKGKGY